jgi:pyruvate dehydrogenase E1 component alpha subunit
MSAESVHDGVSRAVEKSKREKGGPTLLEIKTYRYKGHSSVIRRNTGARRSG